MIFRALSVAVLAVLALASSARAECAWVLWSGTTASKSGIDEALEAFQSQAKCKTRRQQYIRLDESARDAFGTAPTRQERLRGDGTYQIYRCFPDTVDPRAPKASAR
jgi:hypothetical protein